MYNNQRPSTLKDFEFLGKLGQGSFGIVFKVKRKIDKNIYVLKQINIAQMNPKMRKEALNEVKILSALDNPYIVKYYESFVEANSLNIVMEYCEGGDLANYIKGQMKPLNENKAWKFFIQLCVGLAYIHGKKILHRDIKSMNVFLSKQEDVRIGDLGVAKVLAETGKFAHTMIGTPYYLSPEMCEEKPYNAKSDIWALGCVLYEMCTKRHPFEATNQAALILKIINGKYAPIPSSYSAEMIEVLNLCLCRDYKKRPFASTLLKRPEIRNKAKSLSILMEEQNEAIQAIERENKVIEPISSRPNPEKRGSESNILKPAIENKEKKERSPLPGLSPLGNDRLIPPLNAAKKHIVNKSAIPEDVRPKSPMGLQVGPLKKAVSNNEQAIAKQNLSEKDKSPLGLKPKEIPVQNQDRNVKRIRKGAPQILSRQAVNAGNPRVIPKLEKEPEDVKRFEIRPKSRSPVGGRNFSEEIKTPPVFGQADNKKERPITPTGRRENPWTQNEVNKEKPLPVVQKDENLENELFGKPNHERDDENKYSQVSLVKLEDILEKGLEWTAVDKSHEQSNENKNKKEIIPTANTTNQPRISDVDTDFEEDVGTEVQWKIVEEEKVPEPVEIVSNFQQKHYEADEIPVFHVERNIPTFEVNTMDPEDHHHYDDDDEEDHEWNSDEDEKAYYEDEFEDEEDKKKGKQEDLNESQNYGEDFESETEDQESGNTEKREVIMKYMEKAKKEKEMVEQLLKDRSASCIKQIGQETFDEIINFLRRKIGEDENEKEIDDFLKTKLGTQISQAQMSYIMMKILPFEIKKCRLEDDIRGYIFDLQ